jgi:hypothetical protein
VNGFQRRARKARDAYRAARKVAPDAGALLRQEARALRVHLDNLLFVAKVEYKCRSLPGDFSGLGIPSDEELRFGRPGFRRPFRWEDVVEDRIETEDKYGRAVVFKLKSAA